MRSHAVAIAVSCVLWAAQPPHEEHLRVFPGARGYAVRSPAGRGGRILRVTTLNSEGPGSLREALTAKGPRLVVFEVGGIIDLQTKPLTVTEPFLTVAGQTAPPPGITLIRGALQIRSHDVLLRHLRIRPGDAGKAKHSGWEPEVSLFGAEAYNIVIDHCSVSWGISSNLSIDGPQFAGPQGTAHDITVSHSIIAEALHDSTYDRGPHSMGTVVRDNCANVAIIGNLYAHNNRRNPAFRAGSTGVVVNNLIYDAGEDAIELDWSATEWTGREAPRNARVSVVGNVLQYGPSSAEALALVSRKGDAFLADDLAFDRSGTPAAMTSGLINGLAQRPVWPRGLVPDPAAKVVEMVLHHAGARPKDRDDIDKRILSEVHDHKGRIINSQDEVGGYPKVPMTRRRLTGPAATEDSDDWLARFTAEVE